MLWREILRILRCGPSKRPAADPTYNKSNSHPSMSNLNEIASANSMNKGNYGTRLSNSINHNGSVRNQNIELYGNAPAVYGQSNDV